MKQINRKLSGYTDRPVKIIQFGEGNFLRAFVDLMIHQANQQGLFNGNVVLVQPIQTGKKELFDKQECQYTVQLRGCVNQKEVIQTEIVSVVSDLVSPYFDSQKYIQYAKLDSLRFVVSNTTEAGIVFNESDEWNDLCHVSFPAKCTQFLYHRFEAFHQDPTKGLIFLPVELIDDNGNELKSCIKKYIQLWSLPEEFERWVDESCVFTNTLVDRIVTGYPYQDAEEIFKSLDYHDELLDTAEPFGLWVIESEKDISKEFPLDQAMKHQLKTDVIFTQDHHPYKQRKVRILNGAHTSFVLASYLKGNDYVNQSMNDELIYQFMKKTIFDEVIPTLDLPEHELIEFANDVIDRFNNPFIQHSLLAISLNSVSKWRVRCLVSLLKYAQKTGKLPLHLTFSLAALMAFYTGNEIRNGVLIGRRGSQEYVIQDDLSVLNFFQKNSQKDIEIYVQLTLSNQLFWGQDLTKIRGLYELVCEMLKVIRKEGMEAALKSFFGEYEKDN